MSFQRKDEPDMIGLQVQICTNSFSLYLLVLFHLLEDASLLSVFLSPPSFQIAQVIPNPRHMRALGTKSWHAHSWM